MSRYSVSTVYWMFLNKKKYWGHMGKGQSIYKENTFQQTLAKTGAALQTSP